MKILGIEPSAETRSRQWLSRLRRGVFVRVAWGMALALLMAPLAQAGFTNGGFETGDFTGWTVKSYERTALLAQVPPQSIADLNLGPVAANGFTVILSGSADAPTPVPNAPTIGYPRWGSYLARVNNVGNKSTSRQASSIEQTAVMTQADVDPLDHKIHVRFGMAPVLFNPTGHDPDDQPFFYIEVVNKNKNGSDKVLFRTFNYANQPGAPWQGSVGGYLWTDWSAFDIAPGDGLLDPGDTVQIIVFASNCYAGASAHEARVYLDAVGAFLPGLTVAATGPSTTKPNENITYTYNYGNSSGVYAADAVVRVALPITENGKVTSYVSDTAGCTGPHAGTAPRQDYLECSVGDLNNGQTGNFQVTYKVPSDAATSGPNAVLNNGDYNIRATGVSPFQGAMVKTNILGGADPVTDLGVTINNGGLLSYLTTDTPTYTMTVTNHSTTSVTGASIVQTVSGLSGPGSWVCMVPPGSSANCGATDNGTGPISTNTADIPAGQSLVYTYTGANPSAQGTPVNTAVTVSPPAGINDSQTSNNTAGMNTPVVGGQQNVTANASGAGEGHILAVPAALACGDASTACNATGTTKSVGVGEEVRLTPVAHPGSIFIGWTGCTSTEGDVCVITVPSGSDMTATANFAEAHIVTPTVTGGTSGPAGPSLVLDGGSRVFTLTPTVPGSVPSINGVSTCTSTLAGPDGSGNYTYTANNVDKDCAFTVDFVAPQAKPTADVANTPPGTAVVIPVLNNDRGDWPLDPASVTTVGTSTPPTKGTVDCVTTPGVCRYTPSAGQTGADTFTYKVCLAAPNGAICKEATVTVSIGNIGLAATDDVTNTPESQAKTIPVLQNDTPTGGGEVDPATLAKTSDPSNGTVNCSAGACVYTPNPGFTGTDHFTYKACLKTPDGAVCDEAQVTVEVTTAGGGAGPTLDAKDDAVNTTPGVAVNVPVTGNDVATGGTIDLTSVVKTSGPANGTVDCTTTPGTCRYTPKAGFTGDDSFTYKACLAAPNGAVCDEAVVRVQVRMSPASIPTLSEWGLIILSALMGLFALGMHRRRMG